MNRMSYAKEIKQKQELQSKFQFALSQTTNHVSKWLSVPNDADGDVNGRTDDDSVGHVSNNDFFNLPIIPNGTGLSLSQQTLQNSEGSELSTIGEYIKTGVSSNVRKSTNSTKIHKNDSRALSSLRNKLRDSKRQNKRSNSRVEARIRTASRTQNEDEDDDDDEEIVEKSSKKKNTILIDSKIKRKK